MEPDKATPCTTCKAKVDLLAQFPDGKGGVSCLDCYAASPEGRRPVTAEELTKMWGG